jgi:hypothetical protein
VIPSGYRIAEHQHQKDYSTIYGKYQ